MTLVPRRFPSDAELVDARLEELEAELVELPLPAVGRAAETEDDEA